MKVDRAKIGDSSMIFLSVALFVLFLVVGQRIQ